MLKVDRERIDRELEELSAISDAPAPAVTRVVFSQTDRQARAWLKELAKAAGLSSREDAVGNTFFRWSGSDDSLAAVATGSHIDAIPNAGKFDGTVGVLGGLEAIRSLQAQGFRPCRPIELILFTAEEPTRFGIGCLGSRLLEGSLDAAAGNRLRGQDGLTLDEARAAAGFTGPLESVRLKPGHYSAFVELHIEQGPLLEREGVPLGIVTAIAAPASLRLSIEGEGGHAGAALMPDRHDAFLAAAEIALAAEAAAKGTGAIDTVATSGICEVFPGAINSIPSRTTITLDVRDIDAARRDSVLAAIARTVDQVATRRGVRISTETINADLPATCDIEIVQTIAAAANALDVPYREMASRAYHDSLFLSRIARTAMLFIPCRGGYSHRPDEFAASEHIAQGVAVLAETLRRLAG